MGNMLPAGMQKQMEDPGQRIRDDEDQEQVHNVMAVQKQLQAPVYQQPLQQ